MFLTTAHNSQMLRDYDLSLRKKKKSEGSSAFFPLYRIFTVRFLTVPQHYPYHYFKYCNSELNRKLQNIMGNIYYSKIPLQMQKLTAIF